MHAQVAARAWDAAAAAARAQAPAVAAEAPAHAAEQTPAPSGSLPERPEMIQEVPKQTPMITAAAYDGYLTSCQVRFDVSEIPLMCPYNDEPIDSFSVVFAGHRGVCAPC